jgi:hypothetical protein
MQSLLDYPPMKKLLFLFMGLFTLARAQDLACESLFANYPKPTVEITSMESSITSNVTMNGQSVDTNIAQVIDHTNRRLYQTIAAAGQTIVMRYADGKGTMQMKMGEETMDMAVPDESLSTLEAVFDQGLVQGLPENYTIVSCDGPQAYAGLLEGEQVTVTSNIAGLGETTSKIIFGADGKTSGAISTIPNQGDVLIVFDTMELDEANVPTNIVMSMYQLAGEEATPFGTTTINITSYNQPIDESLFAE